MNKKITPGKIIAFFIGLGITGFFWNIFFPAGGSGANILLGIFIAIFFINYFISACGGFIDQEFFPRGSKERARLYRALEKFIRESKNSLSIIKKSKAKRSKIGQKPLDDFEKSIIQGSLVLSQVNKDWDNKNAKMSDHEKMLKEAYNSIDNASKAVFSLQRQWRFLYGIPSLIGALIFALLLREFVVEPYQIPSGSMIPTLLVGDHLFVTKLAYGIPKPFSSDGGFIVKWKEPKPGDVVIFKAPSYVPSHAGQTWIKRLIATEGQTVQINNNIVYVDDVPYPHLETPSLITYLDYFGFGTSDGEWKKQVGIKNIEDTAGIKHEIYMSSAASFFGLGPYWPIDTTKNLTGLSCSSDKCKVEKGYVFVMGDNRGHSSDGRVWGALPQSAIKGKAWFIWMSVDGSAQSVKIGPFSIPRFRFERWFKMII